MVIKRKTILAAVLVFAFLAVGYWGVRMRVNGTKSVKVMESAAGKDNGGIGSVSGEATGASEMVKSSILTERRQGLSVPSAVPSGVPDFVPAFAGNEKGNLNKAEPVRRKIYDGGPLAEPSERRDLLTLSFDSDVSGWDKKKDEQELKVGGKSSQGLLIDSGKYTLNKGRTFAGAGTLSFWLKFVENGVNYGEIPILDWNFVDNLNTYQPSLFEVSYVESQKRLFFSIYDDESNQDDISTVLSDPLEWHKIDIIWDLTNKPFKRVLYIDGNKSVEGDFPIAMETRELSDFTVGGTLGNRLGAKFIIDEIFMTNWAKSAEEIKSAQ